MTAQELDWYPFEFEGQPCHRLDFSCLIPVGDPNAGGGQTGAAVIIAQLPQGRASFTAMAKGDPGEPPDLTGPVTVVEIEHDDPKTPEWDWDIVTPGTADTPAKWGLTVEQRKGPKGDPAPVKFAELTDVYGSPGEGFVPAWSTSADGAGADGLKYEAVGLGIGGQYWPSNPAGNTTGSNGQSRTLLSVQVPPQARAWRPRPAAGCILSGTVNTRPHLVARVGDAVGGDIVGRGFTVPGVAVQNPPFHAGVPAGSDADHGIIPAGEGPTVIYLRAEEQASTVDAYTTAGATTWFFVEAQYV